MEGRTTVSSSFRLNYGDIIDRISPWASKPSLDLDIYSLSHPSCESCLCCIALSVRLGYLALQAKDKIGFAIYG